jgi:2-haloalkanoic acid dehalogenase type II
MDRERPRLFTFDIFGTVVDWRRGLTEAVRRHGVELAAADFDRLIDAQARLEAEAFRTYREVTARSLVEVCGLDPEAADAIGAAVGTWPLYPDSRAGLARLQAIAPCAAMTNSDRAHGEQVQAQLGFRLAHWISAEEVRLYKPAEAFWRAVAERLRIAPGPDWWHVSAYADYDLEVASRLGLTTVFVPRPHRRPGPATHTVNDLVELARRLEG